MFLDVPRQVNEWEQIFLVLAEVGNDSTKLLILSLIMLFGSNLLSKFKCLNLIPIYILANQSYPGVFTGFFGGLMSVLNMDLLSMLPLPEYNPEPAMVRPFNENFALFGFESCSFFANIGSLTILIPGYFI
jgi:hypothetical protein